MSLHVQFEHWNQTLLQEKESVKKRLKRVTYSYTKENHRKLYIQQQQAALLTVEELGLLLKIQKDTNLLKNKNMKQVARSIAEHWHSKQKEHISCQYLYNSMSTVEMGTIRSLEDKTMGFVNGLRKMRGRVR